MQTQSTLDSPFKLSIMGLLRIPNTLEKSWIIKKVSIAWKLIICIIAPAPDLDWALRR